MSMVEDQQQAADAAVLMDDSAIRKQRFQMLVALAILLCALILVLIKDWQFWFSTSNVAEVQPVEQLAAEPETEPTTEHAVTTVTPTIKPKQRASTTPPVAPLTVPAGQEAIGPSITASQRTVLPPLEVEVVAAGQRRTIQPKDNTVKVDLGAAGAESGSTSQMTASVTSAETRIATDASATVRMSPETAQIVSRPVEPSYPLLAKQMKVQGAVVLRALIGKAGNIEDLHVLSGPAILSSAAMEAVKQWRFKPYFQEGRAVETEARITVNFTISTY
jgi:periplasmic protein TonB